MLQFMFLIFFVIDGAYQFWYNYTLLIPAFITGLLGGAVYVNAFTLISKEVDTKWKEFSLSAASVGDTSGIIFANIVGLFIQSCLYEMHHIKDTGLTLTCPW